LLDHAHLILFGFDFNPGRSLKRWFDVNLRLGFVWLSGFFSRFPFPLFCFWRVGVGRMMMTKLDASFRIVIGIWFHRRKFTLT